MHKPLLKSALLCFSWDVIILLNRLRLENVVQLRPGRQRLSHGEPRLWATPQLSRVHRAKLCLSEQVVASLKSWGSYCQVLLSDRLVWSLLMLPSWSPRRRPARPEGSHLAIRSCLSAFTLRNKPPPPRWLRQQAFLSHSSRAASPRSGCRSQCLARAHYWSVDLHPLAVSSWRKG